MKNRLYIFVIAILMIACSEKKDRFNYPLIKSMIDLSEDQAEKFDKITATYSKLGRETYDKYHDDKQRLIEALQKVGAQQDAEIKAILNELQYAIYEREIKIEREGREHHNMGLIRTELRLDSAQQVKFDIANKAFYTALADNHDNYHGKPDVYEQYYKALDTNRRTAFEQMMTAEQYKKYLELATKYNLGKSEH